MIITLIKSLVEHLGFLIGIISMLYGLDDPLNVGPSLMIALLTVLYSVLFSLIFLTPGKYILGKIARDSLKS